MIKPLDKYDKKPLDIILDVNSRYNTRLKPLDTILDIIGGYNTSFNSCVKYLGLRKRLEERVENDIFELKFTLLSKRNYEAAQKKA